MSQNTLKPQSNRLPEVVVTARKPKPLTELQQRDIRNLNAQRRLLGKRILNTQQYRLHLENEHKKAEDTKKIGFYGGAIPLTMAAATSAINPTTWGAMKTIGRAAGYTTHVLKGFTPSFARVLSPFFTINALGGIGSEYNEDGSLNYLYNKKGLLREEGLKKTYNSLKEGNYKDAALSAAGDALNIYATAAPIKYAINAAKAYPAYKKIGETGLFIDDYLYGGNAGKEITKQLITSSPSYIEQHTDIYK